MGHNARDFQLRPGRKSVIKSQTHMRAGVSVTNYALATTWNRGNGDPRINWFMIVHEVAVDIRDSKFNVWFSCEAHTKRFISLIKSPKSFWIPCSEPSSVTTIFHSDRILIFPSRSLHNLPRGKKTTTTTDCDRLEREHMTCCQRQERVGSDKRCGSKHNPDPVWAALIEL